MARILIIEDDQQVRGMLRQTLAQAGHEVVEAADGRAGARLHRAEPADLIITDLYMPEKEGLEMIRELVQDFPDIKIIAISGGGSIVRGDYLPLATNLGALRTFQKPLDVQEILKAIQDILPTENE